ncbi:MAG: hypothetical protein EOM12_18345 [Verrucomicrobiae bacterium]|nr:hypothetical protein [Verrucomicrobiae bacterium]
MNKPEIPIWVRLHGVSVAAIGIFGIGIYQSGFDADTPDYVVRVWDFLWAVSWGIGFGSLYTEVRSSLDIEGKLLDLKLWKASTFSEDK